MVDGVFDARLTYRHRCHQSVQRRAFLQRTVPELCLHAAQIGGKGRERRVDDAGPIATRSLRRDELDGCRQSFGHLRLTHQRFLVRAILHVLTLACQRDGRLHLRVHRQRLIALTSTFDGGIHTVLSLTEVGQHAANPLGIVVADVAQMTGHCKDERIARAVLRCTTQLVGQLLDDVAVGNASVVRGIVAESIFGFSGTRLKFELCGNRSNFGFVGNGLSFQLCGQRLSFQLTSIDVQSTLGVGLAAQGYFLVAEAHLPLRAGVQLRGTVDDVDHALGRAAVFIETDTQCLAVGLLSLLDGHAHRNADVDVQLLRGRILHVQQHALPLTILIIKNERTRARLGNHCLVVDVDASLECELLGQNRVLRTMVVAETEVVRTAEGQHSLQPTTLVLILRLANLVNQTCHLVSLGDVNELLERMLEHFPFRSSNLAVHCNDFLTLHHTLKLLHKLSFLFVIIHLVN